MAVNPQPASTPNMVAISTAELQRFEGMKAQLDSLEAQRQAQAQATVVAQTQALAAKNGVEAAVEFQRQEHARALSAERAERGLAEERAKRYALDATLQQELAGRQLVPGGAEQLTQLWRSQFTVQPEGDSFAVRGPGYQSARDFVSAQLADPKYRHFVAAGSQPAPQAQQPAAPPAPPAEPKTLGEAYMMAGYMPFTRPPTGDPNSDARFDMSKPFGLPGTRRKR